MAFNCGPAKWASILPKNNDDDDGTIFVDRVHGNGAMEGRHRRKGGSSGDDEDLQNGKCLNGPERIEFDRRGFHYAGQVFKRGNFFVVHGTRSSMRKDRDGKEVVDEEVWVGVKTGT